MDHLHKYALFILLATTICINAADKNIPTINPCVLIEQLNRAIKRDNVSGIKEILNTYPVAKEMLKLPVIRITNPPLHLAAQNGSSRALETLLVYGANPNQLNRDGETPLHTVTTANNALFLLVHGADVDRPNRLGETPLHKIPFNSISEDNDEAAEYPDREIFEIFMRYAIPHCNILAQDRAGNTVLHTILEEGVTLNLVEPLLDKARELNILTDLLTAIRNSKGQSALDIARHPFFYESELTEMIEHHLG